jgi:hypothetical protein
MYPAKKKQIGWRHRYLTTWVLTSFQWFYWFASLSNVFYSERYWFRNQYVLICWKIILIFNFAQNQYENKYNPLFHIAFSFWLFYVWSTHNQKIKILNFWKSDSTLKKYTFVIVSKDLYHKYQEKIAY